MTPAQLLPVLAFYRRDQCELCDEGRRALQIVLEERVRRGDPVPRVRVIDITGQVELEPAYGSRIPLIAIGDSELSLATSARTIAVFLDRVLGRLA